MKKIFLLLMLLSVSLLAQPSSLDKWKVGSNILSPVNSSWVTIQLGSGGLRYNSAQIQFSSNMSSWTAIPTSLTGGGWTLGATKVYPTTANTPIHIRVNAGDTTKTATLNNYGTADFASLRMNSATSNWHLLSIGVSNATNLNGYNLVDTDLNKVRTSLAQATDTSSISTNFTRTGKPTYKMVGPTGNTVFEIDSLANAKMSGGIILPYAAKTSTYPITTSDYTINCTANSFTVTLPTAVGSSGKIYVIKNSGTGVITIATTSAQTIDGLTTWTLPMQYESITVQSDNSNWIIL